jgi:hypothetical protein
VDAAENPAFFLDTVSDDATAAVRTVRGERMDRALEAVESMGLASDDYFEILVIAIPADFTCSNNGL